MPDAGADSRSPWVGRVASRRGVDAAIARTARAARRPDTRVLRILASAVSRYRYRYRYPFHTVFDKKLP